MNKIMLQGFEWYLKPEDNHWNHLINNLDHYKKLGVGSIWLPPAGKGHRGMYDSGYGVYDLYDLGEFDQKGSVRTKYGSHDEFLNLIKKMKEYEIEAIVDIVLNHRIGADNQESVNVKVMDPMHRNRVLKEKTIQAWTQFNFNNRASKYSQFKWNKSHFSGIDYDASNHEQGIFLFKESWDNHVSTEMENYDYLMGADVDFRNPEVMEELIHYLKWYHNHVGFSGVRLDAVKHINSKSMHQLLEAFDPSKKLYAVGEYWSADVNELVSYLNDVKFRSDLFDVPLHHKFYDISKGYIKSIRNIYQGTLTELYPKSAVAFVDNHDTQIGQSLESWVDPWFRHHAYAFLLLDTHHYPCVFYTDLNDPFIKLMMKLRTYHQSGALIKEEFNDHHVVVGNAGDNGYLCSINIGEKQSVSLDLGPEHCGKVYYNLRNPLETTIVDDFGRVSLHNPGYSVTIYGIEGVNYESIL